jgi:hypothetical protein
MSVSLILEHQIANEIVSRKEAIKYLKLDDFHFEVREVQSLNIIGVQKLKQ